MSLPSTALFSSKASTKGHVETAVPTRDYYYDRVFHDTQGGNEVTTITRVRMELPWVPGWKFLSQMST